MLKSFEPCKTKGLALNAIFKEHICSTLKMPQEWQKVEPVFNRMTQLRDSFDWKTLTQTEHFRSPIMRTIQDNMETYIRFAILLSKRFVFVPKASNTVKNFKPDWLMAWSQDKITSTSMIFEICNFLFNYVILNFNQGALWLAEKQGIEQYKNALQKIQYVVFPLQRQSGDAKSC